MLGSFSWEDGADPRRQEEQYKTPSLGDLASPTPLGASFEAPKPTMQQQGVDLGPMSLPGLGAPGTPPQPQPQAQAQPFASTGLTGAMEPSWATTSQPQGSSSPTPEKPSAGAPGPAQNSYQQVRELQSSLDAVNAAKDPQSKAVAQDRLARTIYTSLQADGHDVKWQGQELIVDGRPYHLATPPATAAADGAVPPAGPVGSATIPQQQAIDFVNQFATQHLGRPATPEELESVAQFAESVGWVRGGDLTATQWNQVQDWMNAQIAGGYGAPPGTAPPGPGPGEPGGPPAQPGGPPRPTFESMAPSYTPGEVPLDDLDGMSMDQLLARFQTPNSGATDSLMASILQNPESLDARTVGMLKARSADELAEMEAAELEDLKRFGWATGNQDSNWLASEQAMGRRERQNALVKSNRDIDLTAAQTNMEDRRKAATLGMQHGEQGRQNVALAADVNLRAASVKGDRYALREQIKAKATELGIAEDEMQLRYTTELLQDITQRYGIDIGAQIDREQLAQQGREFQEELAFKLADLAEKMQFAYAQLAQEDAQFGADLGYRYAALDSDLSVFAPGSNKTTNSRNTLRPGDSYIDPVTGERITIG